MKSKGFIALISTIIISAILLLVATSLSSASFYNRSNILDAELKERSFALAEGCVDAAVLKLAKNFNYSPASGGETVDIGADTCTIQSVEASSAGKIIKTRSEYRNFVTNLEVEVDSDLSITRFEEK